LNISVETTRAHIDRIFEKLVVRSRLEFALRVVRIHLLVSRSSDQS
jgi:DNA-binding CsgD family transcriptional regulator